MIRAFTISFDFEGKTYLALATVKKKENEEPFYSIRVYDDTLSRFLPDGCIRYSANETEANGKLQHPLAKRLFHCINESVSAHLQSAQL